MVLDFSKFMRHKLVSFTCPNIVSLRTLLIWSLCSPLNLQTAPISLGWWCNCLICRILVRIQIQWALRWICSWRWLCTSKSFRISWRSLPPPWTRLLLRHFPHRWACGGKIHGGSWEVVLLKTTFLEAPVWKHFFFFGVSPFHPSILKPNFHLFAS